VLGKIGGGRIVGASWLQVGVGIALTGRQSPSLTGRQSPSLIGRQKSSLTCRQLILDWKISPP